MRDPFQSIACLWTATFVPNLGLPTVQTDVGVEEQGILEQVVHLPHSVRSGQNEDVVQIREHLFIWPKVSLDSIERGMLAKGKGRACSSARCEPPRSESRRSIQSGCHAARYGVQHVRHGVCQARSWFPHDLHLERSFGASAPFGGEQRYLCRSSRGDLGRKLSATVKLMAMINVWNASTGSQTRQGRSSEDFIRDLVSRVALEDDGNNPRVIRRQQWSIFNVPLIVVRN